MTLDDRPASSDRERDALEFMRRGGKLRGFSPAQIRRVEHRLMEQQRPARRRVWLPRMAVVCLALLAGSAFAAVLSRVPLIASLLPSPKSTDTSETRRTRTPTSRTPVAPAEQKQADRPPVPTPGSKPLAAGASVPEVPPSPLPSSQPTQAPEPRSGTARSASRTPLRLAARAAEPSEHSTDPSRLDGVGVATPMPSGPSSAAPGVHRAAVEPSPTPALAPRPWANTPSPHPEDPVLAESRSLSAAVGRWHVDHDGKAALAALDAHQRRFPSGRLSLESTLLRAEILLQLGREREALLLLDGVSLGGLPRGRELQTVRGELRIKHGRCADGRRDLADVLAKGTSDGFGRRATHAISLCPL